MHKIFLTKLKNVSLSVLPFAVLVVIISTTLLDIPFWDIIKFLLCAVLVIIGIVLFNVGTEKSMIKMGGYVGAELSKRNKVWVILLSVLLIGTIVTIAEPDLLVFAEQSGMDKWIYVMTVALGLGIFFVLATLRIILKVKMSTIFAVCYGAVILLIFFVPEQFVPLACDSSGVTTGPLSVPFIIAIGLGLSAVRSGDSSRDDSFGIVGICSIGPIIAIMIMGAIFGGSPEPNVTSIQTADSLGGVVSQIGAGALVSMKDIALSLTPIVLFFAFYQLAFLKLPFKEVMRLCIGLVYTFIGICIFFVGVRVGFLPLGNELGIGLGLGSVSWILIPFSLVLGALIVFVEPAIYILIKQVEDLTNGIVKKRSMMIALSIGVSISVMLSVVRVVCEIDLLYILVPMILICIIIPFFIPTIFTSIAFDSGGIASGMMASCFIVPFMQGVCMSYNNDLVLFGFGTIALIATTPILVIEIMGLYSQVATKNAIRLGKQSDTKVVTIIEFD